jgi:hypothetical protein
MKKVIIFAAVTAALFFALAAGTAGISTTNSPGNQVFGHYASLPSRLVIRALIVAAVHPESLEGVGTKAAWQTEGGPGPLTRGGATRLGDRGQGMQGSMGPPTLPALDSAKRLKASSLKTSD